MAKTKSFFECSNCGYQTAKWLGRCPDCGKWNTLEEHIDLNTVAGYSKADVTASAQAFKPVELDVVKTDIETRFSTGSAELDRVLGGGIVRGSLVLLGGEPGIGKSTLLLQICGFVGKEHRVLYVSGEESARQIKLRADRLGVKGSNLMLLTETDVAGTKCQAGCGHHRLDPDYEPGRRQFFAGQCNAGARNGKCVYEGSKEREYYLFHRWPCQ